MRNQWLHIILSFILYLSTAGISVHSHYCKNELKDINFWVQPNSCHTVKSECAHHPPQETEDKDCCNNEVSFEKVDTDLISMSMDHMPDWDFVAGHVPRIEKLELPEKQASFGMERYRPPPESVPLHIRYQSFLC